MEHYQEEFKCGVCGREFIVDIQSIGSGHQTIKAVTCKQCAIKVKGNIMGDKVREIKFKPVKESEE